MWYSWERSQGDLSMLCHLPIHGTVGDSKNYRVRHQRRAQGRVNCHGAHEVRYSDVNTRLLSQGSSATSYDCLLWSLEKLF